MSTGMAMGMWGRESKNIWGRQSKTKFMRPESSDNGESRDCD